MKLISRLWNLLLLTLVLALIFHNFTAKLALTSALRGVLGIPAKVGSIELSFLNTQALFRDIELGNPVGLPEGRMAKIPKVFIDLELTSIFQGQIRFETVEIRFEELRVIRFPEGINVLAVKKMESSKSGSGEGAGTAAPIKFQIDELALTLGRATYMDLTGPAPAIRNFNIGIEDARYRNLTGLSDIAKIISWETLKRMALPGLGNVLNQMGSDLGLAPGGAKGIFEKAVLAIKEKL